MWALPVVIVLGAYLCGAIPFGLIIGRALGVDVRDAGSGNIGATNVARVAGRGWGVLVLLLDLAKGLAPVLVARWLLRDQRWAEWLVGTVMIAAVAGHIWTVFLRFRGGKGVATGLGVTIAIAPLAGLLGFGVYVGVYALTRISSIGSLSGVAVATAVVWISRVAVPLALATSLIMFVIVLRHRSNISRLLHGTETKV